MRKDEALFSWLFYHKGFYGNSLEDDTFEEINEQFIVHCDLFLATPGYETMDSDLSERRLIGTQIYCPSRLM